jgi:short-subunit dehydrogenase
LEHGERRRFELGGARVVVAGGSTGIGLATARLLVCCGARVVLIGRDRAKLDAAQESLGDGASVAAFDATRPDDRARALVTIGSF